MRSLTPLPHSCAMTYGLERTNVHAVLSAWSNERAACKRRVPVTGRMYSPLPRSGSWSSRWAGRRCCGKERWAWRRCCCCVARHRCRSSSLAWNRQRGGQRSLTVTHHITVSLEGRNTCCVMLHHRNFLLYLFLAMHANISWCSITHFGLHSTYSLFAHITPVCCEILACTVPAVFSSLYP